MIFLLGLAAVILSLKRNYLQFLMCFLFTEGLLRWVDRLVRETVNHVSWVAYGTELLNILMAFYHSSVLLDFKYNCNVINRWMCYLHMSRRTRRIEMLIIIYLLKELLSCPP